MSTVIGTAIIDIKSDTTKLVSGMTKAENSVKKSIGNIKKTIISLAAAYAGIEGIKAFKNMIDDALDAADAVGKLAQKLGLSSKALSKYQYAAGFAAVSNSELTAGLSALVRRLNNFQRDGGGAAKKAFESLGISAQYARDHFTSTDKAFVEILKRLEKMPDGFKKTAIAQDIFSKNASALLRINATDLKKFGDEAEKIGLTVSKSTYELAAGYHDQMDRISARLKGMNRSIAYGLIAPMNAASKTALNMMDSIFGTSSIQKIKNYENIAVSVFGKVAYSIGFVKDAFTGIKLVLKGLEIAFYSLASLASLAFEPIIALINKTISGYNYLAKKLGAGTINFKLVSSLPDNIAKIKTLKDEIISLSKELKNGRITADEFMIKFKSNLSNIKNNTTTKHGSTFFGIDTKTTTKSIKKVLESKEFKTWQSLRVIDPRDNERYLKQQEQAYLNYYQTIGDYTNAWAIREQEIRMKYTGLLNPDELNKLVEKDKEEFFRPLEDETEKTTKKMATMWDNLSDTMKNSLGSFFDYSSKKFGDFGDLANSILHKIYMDIIQMQVISPMVSGITGGLNLLFPSLKLANGGAFTNGVQMFANGGAFTNKIVSEPTYFAYGDSFGSNLGVMGEAGSEAVMPLTRIGSDLGVKSTPSNVIINVENQSGTPVDMQKISEITNDDGTKTINIVMNAIERNPDFRSAIKGIR